MQIKMMTSPQRNGIQAQVYLVCKVFFLYLMTDRYRWCWPLITAHVSKAALRPLFDKRKCTCSLWSLDTCSSLSPSKLSDNLKQAAAVAAAASHFYPTAARLAAQAAYERLWQRPAHTSCFDLVIWSSTSLWSGMAIFMCVCVKLRKLHQRSTRGEK